MKVVIFIFWILISIAILNGRDDPRRSEAIRFYTEIADAVKNENIGFIGERVKYPLFYWDREDLKTISSNVEFADNYKIIINNKVIRKILEEDGSEIFLTSTGYSTRFGTIHFEEFFAEGDTAYKWKIFAINNSVYNPMTEKQLKQIKQRGRFPKIEEE